MAHYYILSPLTEPRAYFAYVCNDLSIFAIIWISLYFYRNQKKKWWLLITAAFILLPLDNLIFYFSQGLPLLPYGLISPMEDISSSEGKFSAGFTRTSMIGIHWNLQNYLIAIALAWAYLSEKRARNS